MRQMEFEKLEPGDIVYNSGREDESWTVVAPYLRHETFLLAYGRHELTSQTRRLWLIMAMLPDRLCLELADYMDIRVGRIFDPLKWEKESNFVAQQAVLKRSVP
ncbi:MAG: hypothetical protein Q8R55_07210 [Candidatus Taylorbacteria bacterium]|nr:hypothetical protein [Candidatus Taylorbacteria bacterium]